MESYTELNQFVESHGFFYFCYEEKKGQLHCRLMNKGCPGRANRTEKNVITITRNQNHLDDYDFPFEWNFRQALIQNARLYFVPPREIYDNLAKTYDVGASMLPFHNVQNVISEGQDEIIFPEVTSFQQYCDLIRDDKFAHLRRYCLKFDNHYFISNQNFHNDALLLFAANMPFLDQSKTIFISSSNAVLPKIGSVQLLTYIFAEYADCVFPVAFVLWNKRSQELVETVLDCIRTSVLKNVTDILTDFDLKSIVQSIWVTSNVTGSFDSFHRILYYEAHSRGVNISNPNHREFLKKCTIIILLPHDMANTAFSELTENLSKKLYSELYKFIVYFRRIWIELCSHNNCYLYNNIFGLKNTSRIFYEKFTNIFGSNPTMTTFLRGLVGLFNDTMLNMNRLKNGKLIKSNELLQAKNCILNKKQINNIWTKISNYETDKKSLMIELSTAIEKYYKNDSNNVEILSELQLIGVYGNDFPRVIDSLLQTGLKESDEGDEGNSFGIICQICSLNKINIICIPCGHVQICKICSNKIEECSGYEGVKCPFCNTDAYFMKAFLP